MTSKELLGESDLARFKKYLGPKTESGCIEWTGGRFPKGYGSFWIAGDNVGAHRMAFYTANGFWPVQVRHSCDNPPCCNPEHLLNGDAESNAQDVKDRKRYIRPKGYGAKYDEDFVYNIQRLYANGLTQKELVDLTGLAPSMVHRMVRGKYAIQQ